MMAGVATGGGHLRHGMRREVLDIDGQKLPTHRLANQRRLRPVPARPGHSIHVRRPARRDRVRARCPPPPRPDVPGGAAADRRRRERRGPGAGQRAQGLPRLGQLPPGNQRPWLAVDDPDGTRSSTTTAAGAGRQCTWTSTSPNRTRWYTSSRGRIPKGEFFHALVDDRILAAIDALPEEFREVVVLSDVEGLGLRAHRRDARRPAGHGQVPALPRPASNCRGCCWNTLSRPESSARGRTHDGTTARLRRGADPPPGLPEGRADPGQPGPGREQHLAACGHCLQHAHFERNFLAALERAAKGVRCPDARRIAYPAGPPERFAELTVGALQSVLVATAVRPLAWRAGALRRSGAMRSGTGGHRSRSSAEGGWAGRC